MSDRSFPNLQNLKDLTDDSSGEVRKAQEQLDQLKGIVREHHTKIRRFTDLELLVSRSNVDECWDDLSVMRQICAALATAQEHHQADNPALAHNFESVLSSTRGMLRSAEKELVALAALVER